MEYELPEDLRLLRQTVREFANKEIAPIAREIDEEERVPFEGAGGAMGARPPVVCLSINCPRVRGARIRSGGRAGRARWLR
jgi:alkylation response protein AidB-like acyl-CoA dehydrogenase